MRNYRIAFFTADWNYELVEATLRGIRRFVDEHENVRLCVFDCFGKETDSPTDRSEYAIYDLPDLKQFDGILIHPGTTAIDTLGCILVGQNKAKGKVLNSRDTFKKLYAKLKAAAERNEKITIKIM